LVVVFRAEVRIFLAPSMSEIAYVVTESV